MTDDEKTKAQDKSNDHLYFTITPRLVWALCNDPYEYTLWCVIKDIAGEKKECILSRDDMAILAMMSGGKASKCRDSLIAKKILEGDFRRDPGYPQPVWHLTIPDFWEANIRWARKHPGIRDRINFKREQMALRKPSPDDGVSPGDEGIPPRDEGVPPNDRGGAPGDLKKKELKNQKEEPKRELSLKEQIINILHTCAYSAFPDPREWEPVKRLLEEDRISMTGENLRTVADPADPMKVTVSGLSKQWKTTQFTEADAFESMYFKVFERQGVLLTFTV